MNLRPYRVEVLGTPEAGKTTTIKEVISSLDSKGYTVNYVRESAEVVPSEFTKGGIDAHIWMRLHTAQSLLLSYTSHADIVIADRGIIDTLFWDYLFFLRGQLSKSQCDAVNNFFESMGYLPDFVIIFTTSAEEAISRRGGEGRIVTKEFVDLGQILTMIGAGVMVAVTAYMGIKYLTAGPEAQAKLKTQLIGVVVSGMVIFGAYYIWKIVITIASGF